MRTKEGEITSCNPHNEPLRVFPEEEINLLSACIGPVDDAVEGTAHPSDVRLNCSDGGSEGDGVITMSSSRDVNHLALGETYTNVCQIPSSLIPVDHEIEVER